MFRKTKIVCTLGPATDDEKIMGKLIEEGMDVARFNFSHGPHDEQKKRLVMLRRLREELRRPVAALLDTKGPEIRLMEFADGKVELQNGQTFTLTTEDIKGDEKRVSITYKDLPGDIKLGDKILIDDGLIELEVKKIHPVSGAKADADGKKAMDIVCTVLNGGAVSNKKGVNVPNVDLSMPYISEKDYGDIVFGVENDYDFIAASFVRTADDVLAIRKILEEKGGEDIKIIAKIENMQGVQNIDDIIRVSDGIMVARGDMGVEIPFEELPAIQKMLITKCRLLGKRVITATEMLESMIHNPRPTRAEISDVANAVYDGTSAIMLSGETAAGKYPVEAVETMARIAETAEKGINYAARFAEAEFKIKNTVDALSHATCGLAIDMNAKVIAVCSLSGMTARMVSRFRSPVDILGLTTNERTWRKLALSWGVTPVLMEQYESIDVLFYQAKQAAIKTFRLRKGDRLILTGGMVNGTSGNTNLLKVETV